MQVPILVLEPVGTIQRELLGHPPAKPACFILCHMTQIQRLVYRGALVLFNDIMTDRRSAQSIPGMTDFDTHRQLISSPGRTNFFSSGSYHPLAISYGFPLFAMWVRRGCFPPLEWSHIAVVIPTS